MADDSQTGVSRSRGTGDSRKQGGGPEQLMQAGGDLRPETEEASGARPENGPLAGRGRFSSRTDDLRNRRQLARNEATQARATGDSRERADNARESPGSCARVALAPEERATRRNGDDPRSGIAATSHAERRRLALWNGAARGKCSRSGAGRTLGAGDSNAKQATHARATGEPRTQDDPRSGPGATRTRQAGGSAPEERATRGKGATCALGAGRLAPRDGRRAGTSWVRRWSGGPGRRREPPHGAARAPGRECGGR